MQTKILIRFGATLMLLSCISVAWANNSPLLLPPTISAGAAKTICKGESLTLAATCTGSKNVACSAGGFKYKWTASPADASLTAAMSVLLTPTVAPKQTTTYTLTVDGITSSVMITVIETALCVNLHITPDTTAIQPSIEILIQNFNSFIK
jgi:hypothetical protein